MELLLGFAAGVALGAAGYRYSLKRWPDRLEALAAEIKRQRRF
jgi:hypothetical protein